MTSSLVDLQRQTQENLINFLRQEVSLANTFHTIAGTTHDPEHRKKLLGHVQKAITAIRHFDERIEDESIRAELKREADKLDESLSEKSQPHS